MVKTKKIFFHEFQRICTEASERTVAEVAGVRHTCDRIESALADLTGRGSKFGRDFSFGPFSLACWSLSLLVRRLAGACPFSLLSFQPRPSWQMAPASPRPYLRPRRPTTALLPVPILSRRVPSPLSKTMPWNTDLTSSEGSRRLALRSVLPPLPPKTSRQSTDTLLFQIVKERQMEFDVETDPEFMQELFGDDVGSLAEYVTFPPLLSPPPPLRNPCSFPALCT
jgi:hypothetical protein